MDLPKEIDVPTTSDGGSDKALHLTSNSASVKRSGWEKKRRWWWRQRRINCKGGSC